MEFKSLHADKGPLDGRAIPPRTLAGQTPTPLKHPVLDAVIWRDASLWLFPVGECQQLV